MRVKKKIAKLLRRHVHQNFSIQHTQTHQQYVGIEQSWASLGGLQQRQLSSPHQHFLIPIQNTSAPWLTVFAATMWHNALSVQYTILCVSSISHPTIPWASTPAKCKKLEKTKISLSLSLRSQSNASQHFHPSLSLKTRPGRAKNLIELWGSKEIFIFVKKYLKVQFNFLFWIGMYFCCLYIIIVVSLFVSRRGKLRFLRDLNRITWIKANKRGYITMNYSRRNVSFFKNKKTSFSEEYGYRARRVPWEI